MAETFRDMRNGRGYGIVPAGSDCDTSEMVFAEDAESVLTILTEVGDCLVEGRVGAGKSHLVRDIGKLARSKAFGANTLVFSTHINGGTKKGVGNALTVLDGFAEMNREDGLIIVDNIDIYGYSSSQKSRRYSVALAHIEAANYIRDLVTDTQGPMVCATAHDSDWRDSHWQYITRETDEVTPAAQDLLDSFIGRYDFAGEIDPEVAERLLLQRNFVPSETGGVISHLSAGGILRHVIASRLDPVAVRKYGLEDEVLDILTGTEKLTAGIGSHDSK